MKKFITLLLSLVLIVASSMAMVGCDPEEKLEIDVYMPDGAPALSFAKLMHDENDLGMTDVDYTVVNANNIGNYIANKRADVAVLPVNLASKLCADGESYKMAAVLTHGNLFVIGKGTAATLDDLKGQVVGVVQLAQVPGLTFKALLTNAGIEFVTGQPGVGGEVAATAGKVTLYSINGTADEIGGAVNKNYYAVAPQPAVNGVTKQTGASVNMSLQTLWGENGFPQAVMMVKSSLAKNTKFMDRLYAALTESAAWVPDNGALAHAAIVDEFVDGEQTSLKAAALSKPAIVGCNIYVQKSADAKPAVLDYIAKVKAINANAAGDVTDAFFL